MSIAEEYIIERQGKRYALYAGLLAEAHDRGLRSIETELIQIPNDSNHNIAIVKATVETEDGRFDGIGDAATFNVNKNIRPHLIRMAETRAKARAMRDAVNVTEAIHEDEVEDEPFSQDIPAQQPFAASTQQDRPARDNLLDDFSEFSTQAIGPAPQTTGQPATVSQRARIRDLLNKLRIDEASVERQRGPIDEMSHNTATEIIHELWNAWEERRGR